MATYIFETITAAQAQAFNGQVDQLVFQTPSEAAFAERVTFDAAASTITLTSTATGRSVAFGAGLGNSYLGFADRSLLIIGTFGNDQLAGSQSFFGPPTTALFGGDGADTLTGGRGPDQFTGGAGANLFVILPGGSQANRSHLDSVTDWHSIDALSFSAVAGTASNFVALTEPTFAAAFSMASLEIDGGTVECAAVQVGPDVVVFGDSFGVHGSLDAVTLTGRGLTDIAFSNIQGGAQVPPPQLGPGEVVIGTAAGETLRGTSTAALGL